jgi:hypothetical protein
MSLNPVQKGRAERLKLLRLRLPVLDRGTNSTIREKIADMKLEMLSLVLRLDSLSYVLAVFSTILLGEDAGRAGAGGGEQPDHLRHRVKDGATGLHSGEPVLYCAVCLQPPNLAEGRNLLTSGAKPKTTRPAKVIKAAIVSTNEARKNYLES